MPFLAGLVGDDYVEVRSGLTDGDKVELPQATVTARSAGPGTARQLIHALRVHLDRETRDNAASRRPSYRRVEGTSATRSEEHVRALATLRSHTVTLLVTIGAVAAVVAAAVVATGSGPPSVLVPRARALGLQPDRARGVPRRRGHPAGSTPASTCRRPPVTRSPCCRAAVQGFVVAREAVSPFARAALTVGAPAPHRARRGAGRRRGRRRAVPGLPAGGHDRPAGRAADVGGGRRAGGRPGAHRRRHRVGAPTRHRRGVRAAQRGRDARLRGQHRTRRRRGPDRRRRSAGVARHRRRHADDRRRALRSPSART